MSTETGFLVIARTKRAQGALRWQPRSKATSTRETPEAPDGTHYSVLRTVKAPSGPSGHVHTCPVDLGFKYEPAGKAYVCPYVTLGAHDRRNGATWLRRGMMVHVVSHTDSGTVTAVGRVDSMLVGNPALREPARGIGCTLTVDTYRTDANGVRYVCGSRVMVVEPAATRGRHPRVSLSPAGAHGAPQCEGATDMPGRA